MTKKIILACMAIAAFAAFVLPATASAASPRLCETASGGGEPCTTVPVTSSPGVFTLLTATNVGNTHLFIEGGGEVTCTTASLTGKLTSNPENGEPIEADVTSASFTGTGTSGDCTGSGILGQFKVTTNVGEGTPWCVRAKGGAAMVLEVIGGNCGAARKITFALDSTSLGLECKYERTTTTGPVTGTYTTDNSPENTDAIGHVTHGANSTFVRESTSSSFCPEKGELEMSFTLETDETPTATPLYIK